MARAPTVPQFFYGLLARYCLRAYDGCQRCAGLQASASSGCAWRSGLGGGFGGGPGGRFCSRFCWYLRWVSVVMNTSKLLFSAAASNSPFFRVAQPSSKAVETACPTNTCRNGAGVPWSNKTRIQAVANELFATCSNTDRTCAKEIPGNSSTNSPTGTPSSRFSKSAATGTLDP